MLQEFFVPQPAFRSWIDAAKPIFAAAAGCAHVELLNTTVRFVHRDTDTVLAYSPSASPADGAAVAGGGGGGSFAFVLYYRVHRCEDADEQLRQLHSALAQASLRLGGSFYLPYRHHYTDAELLQAYPSAPRFFAKKRQYDPHCVFRSLWFERCTSRARAALEAALC